MKLFNSRSRNTGIILSYINTFLSLICGLFLSSFLLRQLGDADYGVYQTMSSFANYLVLLEFGTGTVMTRNLLACRNKNQEKSIVDKNVSTVFSIAIFLSILSSGNKLSLRITENSSERGIRNAKSLFLAHKSALGRFGVKTSFDATICAPESTATDAGLVALRATTVFLRVALAGVVAIFCVGVAISSPNAARADTLPDDRFTTGKRAMATDGNTTNTDNTLIVR